MAYPNPDTFPYYPPYPPNQSPNQNFGYNKNNYYRSPYNNKNRTFQKNTSTVPKTLQKILDLLPQNLLSCRLTTLKVLPKKKIRNKHKAFMCILNNN
ncbi:YIR001Cp-like protein [Saccharomyces cerevisiae AWRI1631]|uniref:YIR001Cp-like protein n=1 Tax=Saccharomyces cerevisiae (strain AWRI1631) TaxID=545124 RepID=B5VKT6_YEAS6|nr:YIR001Cp-like protein [Saccharomyces cerevisiae AWRI1631]